MADAEETPLQSVLAAAIKRSEKTRDHFDTQLQKILGTKGKPIWDVERGKTKKPSPKVLRAMEEVLGIQADWLVDLVHPRQGTVNALRRSPYAAQDTVEIGKLDLSLSMGPGTLIDDYVEETAFHFDSRLLRTFTRTPPNNLKLVTGIGDSNYPTLQHADDILVDISDRLLSRQDAFYWIDLFGAAGLKRLRTVGKGRVLVQSDNPAVDNQEVDAADLRIHGRAIWVMRGL